MCGVHRDRLGMVLGCESGASEANRLSKQGVCGQGRAESVNLPPELYSGRRGQDLCFIPASVGVTTICVTCTGVEKVWVIG